MSMHDSAVAGFRPTTPPRRDAKASPVPLGEEANRQNDPDERESATQGVFVGPWGAAPIERAEDSFAKMLRRIDSAANGLVFSAVLGLPVFAVSFLLGIV